MPALRNSKHEAFAQALASGQNASDAYVAAGYAQSRSAASRLSTNVNILRRVEQIKARAADKAEWTAADRLLGLKAIYDKTIDQDPRVAISAIAEANKMQGSHAPSQLRHAGANGGPIEYANMTEEEIDARLSRLLGGGEEAPT